MNGSCLFTQKYDICSSRLLWPNPKFHHGLIKQIPTKFVSKIGALCIFNPISYSLKIRVMNFVFSCSALKVYSGSTDQKFVFL